jgi:hypothetical protein
MCWLIYTPSTLPFEVAGECGSADECKTLRDHIQAIQVLNLLIHRLAHALCVRLVLGLA